MPKEKQTRTKKNPTEKLGSIKYTFYLVTMYKYIYPHLEKHTDWTARASSCFSGYRAVMRNSLVRQEAPGSTAKTETFVEVIYTL